MLTPNIKWLYIDKKYVEEGIQNKKKVEQL